MLDVDKKKNNKHTFWRSKDPRRRHILKLGEKNSSTYNIILYNIDGVSIDRKYKRLWIMI